MNLVSTTLKNSFVFASALLVAGCASAARQDQEATPQPAQQPEAEAVEEPGALDRATDDAAKAKQDAEAAQRELEKAQRNLAAAQTKADAAQRIANLDAGGFAALAAKEAGENGFHLPIDFQIDNTNVTSTVFKEDEFTVKVGASLLNSGHAEDVLSVFADWRPIDNPVIGGVQAGLLNVTLNTTSDAATTDLAGVDSFVALNIPGLAGARLLTVPFEFADGHSVSASALAGTTDGTRVYNFAARYVGHLNEATYVMLRGGLTESMDGKSIFIPEDSRRDYGFAAGWQGENEDTIVHNNIGAALVQSDFNGDTTVYYAGGEWFDKSLSGGLSTQLRYTRPEAEDDGFGIYVAAFNVSSGGTRVEPFFDRDFATGETRVGVRFAIGSAKNSTATSFNPDFE